MQEQMDTRYALGLGDNLRELENASLVRRLDTAEVAYAFKHTLTQETAYDSLLRTKRADLHRRVGEAIEELFPDQLEQNAAMLALHYDQAGVADKAFRYSIMAGDLASRAYAHHEALIHYDRALALAGQLDDPELRAKVDSVYAHRGHVFEVRGDFDDALDNYRRMIAHAHRDHDVRMEAEGQVLLLSTRGVLGDVPDAEEQFTHAIDLARQSGDQELVGRALWSFGLSLRFKNPARAVDYFNQALDIARAAHLRELAAFALVDLVIAMQFAGQMDGFLDYTRQALEEFRALDNRSMVANCLGMLADEYHAKGEPAQARLHAEEGIRISETIENPWGIGYNTWTVMNIDVDAGRFDCALTHVKTLKAVMDKIPIPLFQGMSRIVIARLYSELNQLERAHALTLEAFEALGKLESRTWTFWSGSAYAHVLIQQGDWSHARAVLESLRASVGTQADLFGFAMLTPTLLELALIDGRDQAALDFSGRVLERANLEHVRGIAAETFYLRGRVYAKRGDWTLAREELGRAREIAVHAEIKLLLWRVDQALAQVFAAQREEAPARNARQRALNLVNELTGNLNDPVLRESFLKRQDIQELLSS